MRFGLFLASLVLSTLTACGGSSSGSANADGLPPSRPYGGVSGYAVDALIVNGQVSVYSFVNGVKGALLGQGISDDKGYYSVPIQAPSQPILISVSGGFYVEEASGLRVDLQPNNVLTALADYVSGQPITIIATPYTHLAAGLAQFRIRSGWDVSTAIAQSNTDVGKLLGLDIVRTRPLDVTDRTNASPYLSPGLQYGFMTAAISQWTAEASATNGVATHQAPFNSISFAQMMYDDIAADGLLDGLSVDSLGMPSRQHVGTVTIDASVYRHQIARDMLRFAATDYNRTSLIPTALVNVASAYNDFPNSIFGNAAVIALDEGGPQITTKIALENTWKRTSFNAQFFIADAVGVAPGGVSIAIDGVTVGTAVPVTDPNATHQFTINTIPYADGQHTVTATAKSWSGVASSQTYHVGFDNTPPSACLASIFSLGGVWKDNLSGVVSVSVPGYVGIVYQTPQYIPNTSGWYNWFIPVPAGVYPTGPVTFRDAAGNEWSLPTFMPNSDPHWCSNGGWY